MGIPSIRRLLAIGCERICHLGLGPIDVVTRDRVIS